VEILIGIIQIRHFRPMPQPKSHLQRPMIPVTKPRQGYAQTSDRRSLNSLHDFVWEFLEIFPRPVKFEWPFSDLRHTSLPGTGPSETLVRIAKNDNAKVCQQYSRAVLAFT
jgi:hypothetical protein